MIAFKIFLIVLTVIIFIFAWVKNKDIFSPVKIYLAYSVFFYLGIYTVKVQWLTLICYFTLLLSIALCLNFEPSTSGRIPSVKFPKYGQLQKLIWLLSVPGILVKIFFIYRAGGIDAYLYSLAFRVKDWAGQGYLVVWFYVLPALNLIYFCALITNKNRKWRTIVGYLIHFSIFLTVGLLTGSRSYVAITLLGMVMMYSYLVKPVRLFWVSIAGILLIILAGLIGAARNDFGNMSDTNLLESITSTDKFETAQTSYGIIPLELVFGSPEKTLLYGATYLSIFTNIIPRSIFPNKLETGGIAFTRIYTGDQYGGTSNLATGAVTEAIINFGKPLGMIFGVVLNAVFLIVGCFAYRRLMAKKLMNRITIFHVTAYFYLILGIARFSFAEFTDIFHSMLFYALIPYSVLKYFSRNSNTK